MTQTEQDKQKEQIEKVILTSIDTAKAMLEDCGFVHPFGIRIFEDSDDIKLNSSEIHGDEKNSSEHLSLVVSKLKSFVATENVSITALVTTLESSTGSGVGLQVETKASSVLFVYPYRQEGNEWIIEEPIKTDQLLETVFCNQQ